MLLLILSIVMITAIYGRMNYSMELQSNLSSVMEEQISEMMLDEAYNITNMQEFLADFVENLIVALDGKYDLTIDVMQIDIEKGLLALKVTAGFGYLNGNPGEIECERIVIFNQVSE